MLSVEECARILSGRVLQAHPTTPARVIHDSRLVQPGDLFIALPGKHADGHMFLTDAFERGACGAIVSNTSSIPKNAHNLIVVDNTLVGLTRLAAAWRDELSATFIGITGTCGKTTTKLLLGHLLAAIGNTFVAPHSYNTEIGVPIALLSMPKDAEFGVFELGASAPGEITPLARLVRPNIAVLTMVGRGHLMGFGSVDAIAAEKWSLVEALSNDGTAIINVNSQPLKERAKTWLGKLITVGTRAGKLRGGITRTFPGIEVTLGDMRLETRLLGRHNAENVLLAVATAQELGVPKEKIEARIRTFTPPPHRLNLVHAPFGYILDDAYNANPDSTTAALRTLAELPAKRKAFVFGEMRELGKRSLRYHREILDLARKLGIAPIYPIGQQPIQVAQEAGITAVPRDALPARINHDLSGTDNILLIKGSRALRLETLSEALTSLDKGRRE